MLAAGRTTSGRHSAKQAATDAPCFANTEGAGTRWGGVTTGEGDHSRASVLLPAALHCSEAEPSPLHLPLRDQDGRALSSRHTCILFGLAVMRATRPVLVSVGHTARGSGLVPRPACCRTSTPVQLPLCICIVGLALRPKANGGSLLLFAPCTSCHPPSQTRGLLAPSYRARCSPRATLPLARY